jgi:nucleoside-diphosphate-sugar epimerase
VQYQVIGTGMLARAFASNAEIAHGGNAGIGPGAIICAAGVADSQSSDESAFQRVRELLGVLIHRARASDVTLVYFSGAPVYGRVVGLCLETTQVVPETAYGRHKLAWERLLTESGVRYLVLRLPNIVGAAGNPNQLIPSLVAQVARGLVVVVADFRKSPDSISETPQADEPRKGRTSLAA